MTKISDRVSVVPVGVLLAALSAAPAIAQESRPANIGALKLTAPVFVAAAGAPATARSAEAQAPATPPATPPADVVSFFKGTELTGFVDFYYLYNFNALQPTVRAFDTAHNSFSLNLAEIALENKPTMDKRAGYRIDFDYGPTTKVVNGTANGFDNIGQAYLSYLAPVGKGFQFDFGKFLTPMGAEVIKTRDNQNYSRSLLFNFAEPLFHMGIRAAYPVNDQVGLTFFLVNGWNNVTDNNTGKTVGASVSVKASDALSVSGTYLGGPEQPGNNDNWRHALDGVLTYTITPKVTFMGNYDYVKETFGTSPATTTAAVQGVAAYLKFQVNDMFGIAPRFEYLSDSDGVVIPSAVGAAAGTDVKVKEATLTADLKHKDGVRLLIEYRRDFADVNLWLKKDGVTTANHQDTLTFGLVYAFGM